MKFQKILFSLLIISLFSSNIYTAAAKANFAKELAARRAAMTGDDDTAPAASASFWTPARLNQLTSTLREVALRNPNDPKLNERKQEIIKFEAGAAERKAAQAQAAKDLAANLARAKGTPSAPPPAPKATLPTTTPPPGAKGTPAPKGPPPPPPMAKLPPPAPAATAKTAIILADADALTRQEIARAREELEIIRANPNALTKEEENALIVLSRKEFKIAQAKAAETKALANAQAAAAKTAITLADADALAKQKEAVAIARAPEKDRIAQAKAAETRALADTQATAAQAQIPQNPPGKPALPQPKVMPIFADTKIRLHKIMLVIKTINTKVF